MTFERHIGQHVLRVDDDDILVIDFQGPVTAAEMAEIVGLHDQKLVADGDLYVLSNLVRAGHPEPAARHVLGARPKGLPGYCVAYVVEDFRMKLLLGLLVRAANLLTTSTVVHRFFDGKDEARAWLSDMQEKRRKAPSR